jgi:hypothetical protein
VERSHTQKGVWLREILIFYLFILINQNNKYRKALRRKAAVKLENRVLGIKFKNLSLFTQYLRYSSFTAVLNLP